MSARRRSRSDGGQDLARGLLRAGDEGASRSWRRAFSGSPAIVSDARVDAGVAGDVRLDAAGVDGRHRHRGALDLQLHAQRVGEAAHGELGRVVGRLRRDADEAEDAGEVHDVALARCLEVRQERLGPVDHAPEVDAHEPLEVLVGHRLDRGPSATPALLKIEVDLAVVGDHLLGPAVHRVAVGHVEVLRRDLDARGPRTAPRSRPARIVDVAEREVRTPARPVRRPALARCPSPPRDGRHPSVEVLHVMAAVSTGSGADRHWGRLAGAGAVNSMASSSIVAHLQRAVVAQVALVHLPRDTSIPASGSRWAERWMYPDVSPSSGPELTRGVVVRGHALASRRLRACG